MDAESFIHYTETMLFPPLTDSQENDISSDIDKVVVDYLPNLPETERKFALDSLNKIVKFLALLVRVSFILYFVSVFLPSRKSINLFFSLLLFRIHEEN